MIDLYKKCPICKLDYGDYEVYRHDHYDTTYYIYTCSNYHSNIILYSNYKISHIRTVLNEDELFFIFDKNEKLNRLTYDYGRRGKDWSNRVVKCVPIEIDSYENFYNDPIKFFNKIKLIIELG